MSDVKITVGGAIEEEAARRFVDAWHRAERGESFRERNLAFESWESLSRVLTGKQMELAVRHEGRFVTFDGSLSLEAVKGAGKNHLLTL